jgi:hypothetical protein
VQHRPQLVRPAATGHDLEGVSGFGVTTGQRIRPDRSRHRPGVVEHRGAAWGRRPAAPDSAVDSQAAPDSGRLTPFPADRC